MRYVRLTKWLAVSAACLPWLVAGLSPIGDASAAGVTAVPPAEYRPAGVVPKSAALVAPAASARKVVLAPPSAAERAALKAKNASVPVKTVGRPNPNKARPLAIGFPRALPAGS
jgi:hypothetical protein